MEGRRSPGQRPPLPRSVTIGRETSPSALVPSAQYVFIEIDDLRKWTLPSANKKLQPPGWLLPVFWYCPSEALNSPVAQPAPGERILGRVRRYDRVEKSEAAGALPPTETPFGCTYLAYS